MDIVEKSPAYPVIYPAWYSDFEMSAKERRRISLQRAQGGNLPWASRSVPSCAGSGSDSLREGRIKPYGYFPSHAALSTHVAKLKKVV